MLGHPETVVAKAIHERGHGLGLAQRSCKVRVRVTPLVDGCPAITDVVEVGMNRPSNLVIIANFWSPTSQGRIAGYRIRNAQSAGLESRSTKNGNPRQKTDMRVDALDDLTVELQDEA